MKEPVWRRRFNVEWNILKLWLLKHTTSTWYSYRLRCLVLSERIYRYFAFHSNVTEVEPHTRESVHAAKPKLPNITSTPNAPFFARLYCHSVDLNLCAHSLLSTFLFNFFFLFAFFAPSSLAAPIFCFSFSPCVPNSYRRLIHLRKNCATMMTSRVLSTHINVPIISVFRLIVLIFVIFVISCASSD